MIRSEYRKWLFIFIAVLIVCVLAIFAYMYLSTSGILINTGMIPWILAVIAAGGLGVLSNKFTKTHRQYEAALYQYKITDEDVKAFLADQKGQA